MAHPVLLVNLLGGFHIAYNDTAILGVHAARLQSLLIYLILHADSPQPRQRVAFLIWPDSPEAQARNNLRQFFFQLRQALPEPDRFLSADTHTICWKTDEGQQIDVQRFRQALQEAEAAEHSGDQATVRKLLEQAVSLYQGDLVPDCYDEWIAPEREALRRQCQDACQKLAAMLEAQREYAAAILAAEQLLRLDPPNEETYAALMRLHTLNDDRAGARRVYREAAEVLERELGVEPGETLRSMYERLQHLPPTFAPRPDDDAMTFRLVGRLPEWQKLQSAWKLAGEGAAHFALVTGEAGIGKSRLAEELFHWVKRQGYPAAQTRSYGAEGRLSLAPVIELLRSEALRPNLASLNKVWLAEITRLLPELLSEHRGLSRPEPISEYGQRRRFFEALARAVLAAPQPLLLWIDDLHWCDQETLDWLHFLLRFEPRHSLLILGTARSEEMPPEHPLAVMARQLQAEDRITPVELSSLDAAETAKLASQVRGKDFDTFETISLFHQTEGNPLFVIETTRAGMAGSPVAERTAPVPDPDAAYALPPRVQAVIAGRLSQLSPAARRAAEVGAAIGQAFSFDLLAQAGRQDEEAIAGALDELWQKRIIREQSANVYDFTHDKLREVAYAEISAPQRRLLHRRIAQALETLNQENLDSISPRLATQYELAGMFEQALPYYQRAGSVAAGVYANADAIDLFEHGRGLLPQLPAGTKRDEIELNFCLALAPLYRITRGWASPEVEQVLNRALILSNTVGNDWQRAQTLYGFQSFNVVAARLEKVQSTYPEMSRLFEQLQGSSPPFAGLMYGGSRLHMGQVVEATEQLGAIVKVRDSRHIRDLQESQGVNYMVLGLAWGAHGLWCLGQADAALESAQNAIAFAQEFEQPFNQGLALTYMASLQEWCADPETFLAHAKKAYDFTREYQVTYYHSWASVLLQFGLAWQQPDGQNLAKLREAIRIFIEMGAHLRLPVFYSLLGRALQRAGRIEEALEAVELGLTEALHNSERWWDPELHRLRGELLAAQGATPGEAEAAFQHALQIARQQGSKALELRAALSLARLWQAGARVLEARQLLAPLVENFSEGANSPDLRKAREYLTPRPPLHGMERGRG